MPPPSLQPSLLLVIVPIPGPEYLEETSSQEGRRTSRTHIEQTKLGHEIALVSSRFRRIVPPEPGSTVRTKGNKFHVDECKAP